jgi:hypothetical protein
MKLTNRKLLTNKENAAELDEMLGTAMVLDDGGLTGGSPGAVKNLSRTVASEMSETKLLKYLVEAEKSLRNRSSDS